ncbi:MAG: 1,4-alpha-glucan branching protein [Chitinophagaceae bacterium]|nr:1,4-alpha-glucan branching protein [Chitinophagaceae bacterium]
MNADFKTIDWGYNTNIYEINIRQYTGEGTFNAFAAHLPRLKDMGVQILWFMPIHPIGNVKRLGSLGSYYSIKDYQAINPEFGNLDDFKSLVRTAHQLGFKVMMDWVANHTAWDHVWTNDHPDFYERDGSGNFKSPYDWEDVIQINHNNVKQQDAMIASMKFWLDECDIDGYRCDMAHLIPLSFWQRARKELELTKKLFWLAETEDAIYHEVFDASYAWEFLHKMEQYWRKETDTGGLDHVLYKYNDNFPKDALRALCTSNHDENSHSGSEYERMGDAATVFAVLCATWNGIPLIYSGQELPNKKRLKFFDKDVIDWNNNFELHDFYKSLLNLHSSNPALKAGDPDVLTYRLKTTDGRIFSYLRRKGNDEVLVLLNLSAGDVSFTITGEQVSGNFKNIFSGLQENISQAYELNLQAWGYLVFEKKRRE